MSRRFTFPKSPLLLISCPCWIFISHPQSIKAHKTFSMDSILPVLKVLFVILAPEISHLFCHPRQPVLASWWLIAAHSFRVISSASTYPQPLGLSIYRTDLLSQQLLNGFKLNFAPTHLRLLVIWWVSETF